MKTVLQPAPELVVSQWLNTSQPLTLASLKGRVIVLHAFQMLCPGCVAFAIPQIESIRKTFPPKEVAIIGLHTVFEHHAVMNAQALKAFVHEYRITYPIAIDQPDPGSTIPITMQTYDLRGTPSMVLIDRNGYIRLNHFGRLEDMQVGAILGQLVTEGSMPAKSASPIENTEYSDKPDCRSGACVNPADN